MELVIFISGALIFTILLLIIFIYSGLLSTIDIQVTEVSTPGTFFYKFYQQSYSESASVLRELFKWPMVKANLKLKCMGIYYDDPDKVGNLLFLCGVFIIA